MKSKALLERLEWVRIPKMENFFSVKKKGLKGAKRLKLKPKTVPLEIFKTQQTGKLKILKIQNKFILHKLFFSSESKGFLKLFWRKYFLVSTTEEVWAKNVFERVAHNSDDWRWKGRPVVIEIAAFLDISVSVVWRVEAYTCYGMILPLW